MATKVKAAHAAATHHKKDLRCCFLSSTIIHQQILVSTLLHNVFTKFIIEMLNKPLCHQENREIQNSFPCFPSIVAKLDKISYIWREIYD